MGTPDPEGRLDDETFIFFFLLLRQGVTKICEGEGRNAKVRSLRSGVGVCTGPSATHSSTKPQAEWTNWPALDLPGSSCTQGPGSSPMAAATAARTPF